MLKLQAEHLSKKFNQKTVFRDLSFELNNGILGISGSNGSGKSTLMKCLAGLLKPSGGQITWSQHDEVLDTQEVKPYLGYAAPYINLYSELNIEENLRFLLEVNRIPVFESNLKQLLESVQIASIRKQKFGSLSTGQKQRVKLAAALVRDPQVLMLDEPGSNLDAKGHKLVEHLVGEALSKKKLVIIASNDPAEIELCDQVIHLTTHES